MKGQNPECPCGSGARYGVCCRPFHRGEEPPDPERLMRSRFAAFALGEVAYLFRTLDPDHPDRQRSEVQVGAEIRALRSRLRYARLRIVEAPPVGDSLEGRVLFHAEIYEKGKEVSFAELSLFRKHPEGWRYLSGELRAMRAGSPELSGLSVASFAEQPRRA